MSDANDLSTYWFSMSKDTPAKRWFMDLPPLHAATYRALGISCDDLGAVYACSPFRLNKTPERVTIWAAYPAPAVFEPADPDWLGIETVIEWNPVTDTAAVIDDDHPQIIGNLTDDANALYSSPRSFFQAWAQRRARFAVQRQQARAGSWKAIPKERDDVPGGLVIGATTDIHWQPSVLPEHIRCVGINPGIVNKGIMRAARLPRATGGAV